MLFPRSRLLDMYSDTRDLFLEYSLGKSRKKLEKQNRKRAEAK